MSEIADTIKIVSALNDEENDQKRFRLIAIFFLSTILFFVLKTLFLENKIPNTKDLINRYNNDSVDKVFFNLALVVIAFALSFVAIWILPRLFKFFYKICLHLQDYSWKIQSELKDWEFQGNVVVDKDEKAIHIIQSDLGLILKGKEWKDYEMSFLFKIPKKPKFSPEDEQNNQLRRGFGIIYRANKLGEYYMLKIDINGYHPHVRHVTWENNGPIQHTSLKVNDLDKWLSAKITVTENFLKARIENDEIEFLIPTHSNISKEETATYTAIPENLPYSKIPFRYGGTIGFRSAFFEEVYIKDLKVKHVFKISC